MSQTMKQIVIYRVQPHREDDFADLKAKMIEESLALDGLVSSTTERALDEEHTYVDTMVWRSLEAARAGNERFPALPSAGTFMGLMAGPPVANLFHTLESE